MLNLAVAERKRIKFYAAGLGASSLGVQIILLRQFLTVLYGNELVIGVVMSLWLLWVGIGSMLGHACWKNRAPRESAYPSLLIFTLFIAILVYSAGKFVRYFLQTPYGEHLSYADVFVFAGFILCVPAISFGFLYSLLARMSRASFTKNEPAAVVYAYEAFGTFVVGVVFTFMLAKYSNLFCLFALTVFQLVLLMLVGWRKTVAVPLILVVFLLMMPASQKIEDYLLRRYWQSVDATMLLREWQFSRFGQSSILEWGGERFLYHNGAKVTALTDDIGNQVCAATILCQHPNPQRILLIEGNAGGLALQCADFVQVDVMEMDGDMLDFVRLQTDSSARDWNRDNINIRVTDARRALRHTDASWDMIILNVGAPMTALSNRYYTKRFFALAKERLEANGVFAICHFPSAENYLGAELLSLNKILLNTLQAEFSDVLALPGDEAIFFAADSASLLVSTIPVLQARFRAFNPSLQHFVPDMFQYIYSQQRIDDFAAQLGSAAEVRVNSDFNPISYIFDFLIWHKTIRGDSALMRSLASHANPMLFLLFLLLTAMMFLPASKGARAVAVRIRAVAFIVGFMGMALSMVLLLAFQTLFGYIYAWISFAMAAYMAGMGAAAMVVNKRIESVDAGRLLARILLIAIILQLALTPILTLDPLNARAVYILFFIFAGALVGAAYPLVCRLYLCMTCQPELGGIYAADVLGGAVGALLIASAFIPLYGFFRTLLFSALMCCLALFLMRKNRKWKQPGLN
ncbi:hypothetical protein JXA02_13080 [candidate division KSB1 bacterium]|nr:hypothetical protein [candidate division KSB1 bacterium]